VVEGGTAAMCYIFKSLKANRLLHRSYRKPWIHPEAKSV